VIVCHDLWRLRDTITRAAFLTGTDPTPALEQAGVCGACRGTGQGNPLPVPRTGPGTCGACGGTGRTERATA
jgi:DnaJ-class molecular chaperone